MKGTVVGREPNWRATPIRYANLRFTALAQLIEFEAKTAFERAEVGYTLDQVELLDPPTAEPEYIERINRMQDTRTSEATHLVERMRS